MTRYQTAVPRPKPQDVAFPSGGAVAASRGLPENVPVGYHVRRKLTNWAPLLVTVGAFVLALWIGLPWWVALLAVAALWLVLLSRIGS